MSEASPKGDQGAKKPNNGWVRTVVDYGAKVLYSVENIQFPSPARKDINYERKDSQLVFAGDTNIIVEITATNVVVKAISNDKPTTIPLAPPPASTPARKAP